MAAFCSGDATPARCCAGGGPGAYSYALPAGPGPAGLDATASGSSGGCGGEVLVGSAASGCCMGGGGVTAAMAEGGRPGNPASSHQASPNMSFPFPPAV